MKMCEWYILITHDNCTCIFHDLSELFSSAHEVYRFRRALPCFYPGKVTVTIIRSKRGGMFKMLLWDFWQRIGHELINIHLGTDDSPCVVRPWLYQHSREKDHIHMYRNNTFKVPKVLLKSMSLTKDYSLAIIPQFLNPLVVPENKRKCVVFSFRPIDSIVFLKLEDVLFHYRLTPFRWMWVQWTSKIYLFYMSKIIFGQRDTLTLISPGYFGGWVARGGGGAAPAPPFRSRPWIARSPRKFA